MDPLKSTAWLSEHLDRVVVIDASWRMPGASPAIEDYKRRHIAGAIFFDIDAISDQTASLPHTAPQTDQFEAAMGALGINADDTIVVYDDQGIFSAPRVWWTFRLMGHKDVFVLDGGLKKWCAEGRPTTALNSPQRPPRTYKAERNDRLLATAQDVRVSLDAPNATILDARPAARFFGDQPEPRAGLRSGAMPGAISAPFSDFVDDEGCLLSVEALRAYFGSHGIAPSNVVISTCGSGVTAAIPALAFSRLGYQHCRIYDGSWAEWGRQENDIDAFPVSP